jgi:coenzyme F420-reducing hydrogenase gamma subunit
MTAPNGKKPKFAMYWAASCGGCEIAVLNIHEKILDVDANFEVVSGRSPWMPSTRMSKRWKTARSY